jgi:hypothetical protein
MDSERFRQLLTAKGPFASIYYDDSHDTEDAAAQLDARWRDMRKHLEQQSVDEALISTLEQAVVGARPPVGRSGRGVIAGADGVAINEHLIRPPEATTIRVSELPYIVPLVEHAVVHRTYVLAAVDHAGGDITLHQGRSERSETVDGGGYPVHKAKGAETPGYGDPQPRTEEQTRKNIRAVAERLTSVVDETGAEVVFVRGEVRSRADLVAELPERVANRVVELDIGARNSVVDEGELSQAIHTEFQLRRLAAIDDAAQRFQAETGRQSGLAAEGLGAVCAALRDGAVDTLIIGDIGDATVVAGDDLALIAQNADVLSELGAAPSRTLRADEALPMVAVAMDASLVRIDERLEPADGIAAVLRYARAHN